MASHNENGDPTDPAGASPGEEEPADDTVLDQAEVELDEATAARLKAGDFVWVPTAVTKQHNPVTCVVKRQVIEVERARIRVENGTANGSGWIRASRAFKNHGVLVVVVGDFDTEWTLLDPLSNSLVDFLRLLLGHEAVSSVKVRGLDELGRAWAKLARGVSHVVFVGHGAEAGLFFGADEDEVPGPELAGRLTPPSGDVPTKIFLFLTCEAGVAAFAKGFSLATHVEAVIAPLRGVHGAEAALFAQAFFTEHFLRGGSAAVAFKRANMLPSLQACRFRVWRNGELTGTT